MRISVLVPTYRRPRDLERCLSALLSQVRRPDQVVLVVRDTDSVSQGVIESHEIRRRGEIEVEVATVRAPGVLAALNAGFPRAKGDVVCFTDDDAEPLPDWLQRIARWYEDPAVLGVGGRDLLVRQPATLGERCRSVGQCSWFGRVTGNHHLLLEPERPVDVCVLKGVNMSYRLEALAGFRFDERMASYASSWYELDMGFVVRRTGRRLVYDPGLQVRHYESPRIDWSRDAPIRCYDEAHNYTYVMLKHLPWGRRLVFLAYAFLVGSRVSWTPLRAAYELVVRRRAVPWTEIGYSMAGKCVAVWNFVGWWWAARAARPAG